MKEHYTLQELLEDPTFQLYVEQPDSPEARQWELWLENNPQLRPLASEAIQRIQGFGFRKQQLPDSEVEHAWKELSYRIPNKTNQSRVRLYWLAASVSLLLLAAAGWWYISPAVIEVETTYGETRQLSLPDSSQVTLNANSRLSYDPASFNSLERRVYLDGEAFFEVAEVIQHGERASFSVLPETGGVIEVLGTKFNVLSRRNTTQVVLQSGKVKFSTDEEQTTLQPGEMVEYSHISRRMSKRSVEARQYSAWKQQQLIFDDTPLGVLALQLEDRYGLKVVFEEASLAQKEISGTISARDARQILTAIERIFSIQATLREDTVYISSYNP